MKIKIKQLGNGGAFDYNSTNSSFLIDLGSTSESVDSSLLLFDCGNNVYKKLREIDEVESNIIKRIKYVFISHMDDDHIGSLKTLIYYNYFVNNKIMQIICGSEVYPSLVKYLEDVDGFVDNYEKIQTNLFYMVSLEKTRDWNLDNNVKLNVVPAGHGKPCYGVSISNKEDHFIITGDTKANTSTFQIYSCTLIFHDFSKWNNPGSQVHCCETDLQSYSEDILNKIKKYHDNEPFNDEWLTVQEHLETII